MNDRLLQASAGFLTITQLHETTKGEPCYVAYHPELPNCIGQGMTPKEAADDLVEATILTLQYLDETGQAIPQRTWLAATTPIVPPEMPITSGSLALPSLSERQTAFSLSMQ